MISFGIRMFAVLTASLFGAAILAFAVPLPAFADDPDEPPAATQSEFWAMARRAAL